MSNSNTKHSTDDGNPPDEPSDSKMLTLGRKGTTGGDIPVSINRFTGESLSQSKARYESRDDTATVYVHHSQAKQDSDVHQFQMELCDTNGETVQERVIEHGSLMDRDIHDAAGAVKTQLWEWGRHSIDKRCPIHAEIEKLGEPDPHPPGERPGVSGTWYYSFNHESKKANDPNTTLSSSGTYVPHSRYEFRASNRDRNWYCGTLVLTFNHEPPESIEGQPDHVYGTYLYLSLTPLKPVDERINQYDTREIDRRCLRHDEPHEALSHEALLGEIEVAQEELISDAEAIGDKHRQAIIEEANRRLNEETGEYEDQVRITSF